MTTEAPFPNPAPRPQCPRCGTPVPLTGTGTQVIRCTGCAAALQVHVKPLEASAPRPSDAPPVDESAARPRRRPMVEVAGPRRPEPAPTPAPPPASATTFTVELSQSDIDTDGLVADPPASAAAAPPPPARPPTPPPATHIDTPWFAEDIERLPEASGSLGQLTLESFEPLPPLPLRPDVSAARSGASPTRPAGPQPSPLQDK